MALPSFMGAPTKFMGTEDMYLEREMKYRFVPGY